MEDEKLKKRLKKIPNVDKNGDPIYKIDTIESQQKKEDTKLTKVKSRKM